MRKVLILIIKGYKKVISPLLPPSCRFYPSCSTYAMQALEKYGIIKGSIKAIYRILRCNPFNKGGYDPVK
ncbi:MAG: membrane protein insertion efficiency factor YidD [Actinobacteria bacterium]|nr:membrane protein insertion efficiency factor YidD [Actinomycetota bacterium]